MYILWLGEGESEMTQKQYKFSLSIRDKHHRTVKKIVDGLLEKGNGALSQSIRDGLRLLNDLRRGNVTVLLDMFPDIVDKLCTPTPPNSDDIKELKREIEALRNDMRQQQHSAAYEIPDSRNAGFPAMKQSGSGIGTLGKGVSFSLPNLDDDELPQMTMKLAPLSNATNGSNLIAGILGLD